VQPIKTKRDEFRARVGAVMIHTVDPNRAPRASTGFVAAHWTQDLVRAGLPIFFMLSGALLFAAPARSPGAFYLRRLSRLLIPFFGAEL
jgi:peptidoglycan/LPS O-acetylase OafA/YrhL